MKAGQPDQLADAPGGKQISYRRRDTLDRGKSVFAETCARCHSSKLPDEARAKCSRAAAPAPTISLLESLLGLH